MVISISMLQVFLLCVIILLVDRRKMPLLAKPFENIGRIAFSAYYIHFAVIIAISAILSRYNIVVPMLLNPILLVALIIFIATLEVKWRKYNYILGVEWLFRSISKWLIRVLTG